VGAWRQAARRSLGQVIEPACSVYWHAGIGAGAMARPSFLVMTIQHPSLLVSLMKAACPMVALCKLTTSREESGAWETVCPWTGKNRLVPMTPSTMPTAIHPERVMIFMGRVYAVPRSWFGGLRPRVSADTSPPFSTRVRRRGAPL
jgi:hypothetical protein